MDFCNSHQREGEVSNGIFPSYMIHPSKKRKVARYFDGVNGLSEELRPLDSPQ